jgi:hypothetical protein
MTQAQRTASLEDSHIVSTVKRPPLRTVPARQLARQVALVRIGIGAGLLVAPVAAARALGTDSGTARRTSWLARTAAVRDVVIGAGALSALHGGDGTDAARWLVAGTASDLGDTLVFVDAVRRGHLGGVRGALLVAASASGVVTGAVSAAGLRRG